MCSHDDPVVNRILLETYLGVSDELPLDFKHRLRPGYMGLFVRRNQFVAVGDEALPFRELQVGSFGLIPY